MKYTDQLNNSLYFNEVPNKIVSLVPSITELLCSLGCEEQLIGVTKFCVHPEHIKNSKKRIGGTKNPDLESIRKLDPDLIIANKEENRLEDITSLQENYQVYISDVINIDSSLSMIRDLGFITGHANKAMEIESKIRFIIDNIVPLRGTTALYIIWQDPIMAIGAHTYIDSILTHCGIENAYKGSSRYPELTDQSIKKLSPDLILLSTEPYPFNEVHLSQFKNKFPESQVSIIDGEVFSWYGSRLIQKNQYLNQFTESLRILN